MAINIMETKPTAHFHGQRDVVTTEWRNLTYAAPIKISVSLRIAKSTNHKGSWPIQRKYKATLARQSLSASGSRIFPISETSLVQRAALPSNQSVNSATIIMIMAVSMWPV